MAAKESATLTLGFIFWDADTFASSTSKASCLPDQVNCGLDVDSLEREDDMETDEGRKVVMLRSLGAGGVSKSSSGVSPHADQAWYPSEKSMASLA